MFGTIDNGGHNHRRHPFAETYDAVQCLGRQFIDKRNSQVQVGQLIEHRVDAAGHRIAELPGNKRIDYMLMPGPDRGHLRAMVNAAVSGAARRCYQFVCQST